MARVLAKRWEIQHTLDEGGQAHIFLVTDLSGEYRDPCVLKRAKNPKRFGRFTDEVRALNSLNHPYLLPIIDTGDDRGSPFYVAPFYEGGTLERQTERFKANVLEAIHLSHFGVRAK